MADLFDNLPEPGLRNVRLQDGVYLLHQFASPRGNLLVEHYTDIVAQAPLRHMVTPTGRTMAVAMTSCGQAGWISDRRGYRYSASDPLTGRPWPAMPAAFMALAADAARVGGFENFRPDSCLINRYLPGNRLSLHQDSDELDFAAPIVSVSLGLPATFLFGGLRRAVRARRFRLEHGDVVVWGGPARLVYHGISPLADDHHPVLGRQRINLTFRKAL